MTRPRLQQGHPTIPLRPRNSINVNDKSSISHHHHQGQTSLKTKSPISDSNQGGTKSWKQLVQDSIPTSVKESIARPRPKQKPGYKLSPITPVVEHHKITGTIARIMIINRSWVVEIHDVTCQSKHSSRYLSVVWIDNDQQFIQSLQQSSGKAIHEIPEIIGSQVIIERAILLNSEPIWWTQLLNSRKAESRVNSNHIPILIHQVGSFEIMIPTQEVVHSTTPMISPLPPGVQTLIHRTENEYRGYLNSGIPFQYQPSQYWAFLEEEPCVQHGPEAYIWCYHDQQQQQQQQLQDDSYFYQNQDLDESYPISSSFLAFDPEIGVHLTFLS